MRSEKVEKDKKGYCDWAMYFMKTHFSKFLTDEFFVENIRQMAELGFDRGYNSCSHEVKEVMSKVIDNF
jgi:hypothetical protein